MGKEKLVFKNSDHKYHGILYKILSNYQLIK